MSTILSTKSLGLIYYFKKRGKKYREVLIFEKVGKVVLPNLEAHLR